MPAKPSNSDHRLVAAPGAAVFTLRDGKIAQIKLYQTSGEALRAAGVDPAAEP